MRPSIGRPAILAWFLYDWAGRSIPTVITTFVFAAYFTQGVAENPAEGMRDWGVALGLSGLLTAILAPTLGGMADRCGRLKPWLALATLVAVVAAGLLWFIRPHVGDAGWAAVLLSVTIVGHEVAGAFYNALLPGLCTAKRLGRVSGQGWAVGAIGGLVCLALCLFGLIRAEPMPFGLDPNEAEPVRAASLVAAAWYLIFAIPLFLLVPDRSRKSLKLHRVVSGGLLTLPRTVRQLRYRGSTLRFLAASLAYLTGLETLVALGGIYAAATFHMRVDDVMTFGIGILASAAAGALLLGWIDDRLGARPTLLLSLAAIVALGSGALAQPDVHTFRLLGFGIGFCLGPAEASGRSLMARLTPAEFAGEMFGLYALARHGGRAAGTLALTLVASASASPQLGMAAVLCFIVVGFLILLTVQVPRHEA